jgi:hypothetical protein
VLTEYLPGKNASNSSNKQISSIFKEAGNISEISSDGLTNSKTKAKLNSAAPRKPAAITLPLNHYPLHPMPEESDKEFTSKYPDAKPGSLQERYNLILGMMAKTRPATSRGDDHQAIQEILLERYAGNPEPFPANRHRPQRAEH